jgi:hypothetical protein
LRKFASMGSALCFPVEAMVFFIAIVSIRLAQRGNLHPSSRDVQNATHGIYVYGDDIIVPVDLAPLMVEGLSSFGLKVNAAKSFWTGKFRESCGRDYYGGVDVSVVYCRRGFPHHRADVSGLISAVEFANQLYFAGLWASCRMVRSEVEKILGPLPSITEGDQVLGWKSFSNARSFHSWDSGLQRPKSRCWTIVSRKRGDPLEGDPALLKCLRLVGQDSPMDRAHLLTSVRFGDLALKRRWT